MSGKRPAEQVKAVEALTEQDKVILRLKNEQHLSFREIGARLNMTRGGAQIAYRRAGGRTGRIWRSTNKAWDDEHVVEVSVGATVRDAANARLAVLGEELGLYGSVRPTLAAVCRELIRMPLGVDEFPQKPQPFTSSPPGSVGDTAQVVRWTDVWGEFNELREDIHVRGYSVSQVIDERLERFARSGILPGALRYYQQGHEG